MRYLVNELSRVSSLIRRINKTSNSKIFHLDDNIKIGVSLFKRCFVCKQFHKNSDMEKIDDIDVCFWCKESVDKDN